jgi:hypothetical protein
MRIQQRISGVVLAGIALALCLAWVQSASAQSPYEHWMADQADVIGQRSLRQVVMPGSHDAATYENPTCNDATNPDACNWPDAITRGYAQAQSQDITGQLNAGSRYLDLRFTCYQWQPAPGQCNGDPDNPASATDDYYVNHGGASKLAMTTVLSEIVDWIEQPGHEQEIVVLDFSINIDQHSNPSRLQTICENSIGEEIGKGHVLLPSMVPPNMTLYDMSMNELWALPGQPRLIVKGWDSCTNEPWPSAPGFAPAPISNIYADACTSDDTIYTLALALQNRYDASGLPVGGLYGLDIQAEPLGQGICPGTPSGYAINQGAVLNAIKGWWQANQNNAWANLNFVVGDFVGDPQADTLWPIVQTAVGLNQTAPAPRLSLTTDRTAPKPVTVTCDDPLKGPLSMSVYPTTQGPQSPSTKVVQGNVGTASVQVSMSMDDFPGVPNGPDGFLLAECHHPLDATGALTSRLVIPLDAFQTPIVLTLGRNPDGSGVLYCRSSVPAKGPLTINVSLDSEGSESQIISFSGLTQLVDTQGTQWPELMLPVSLSDVPADYYGQVTATCVSSDSPPLTGPPLTFLNPNALPANMVPIWLVAQQQSGGPLEVVCKTAYAGDVTISASPNRSPADQISFSGTPGGSQVYGYFQLGLPVPITQSLFPAGTTYLGWSCVSNDSPPLTASEITLSASAFPPGSPLSLVERFPSSPGSHFVGLACGFHDPAQVQVTGPLTITAYPTSEGPQNPPYVHSRQPFQLPDEILGPGWLGLPIDLDLSQFPAGQVTVTCASSDSPPVTALPLTLD